MLHLSKDRSVVAAKRTSRMAAMLLVAILALASLLLVSLASSAATPASASSQRHVSTDDVISGAHAAGLVARWPVPAVPRREGRRLVWSDFLYPAKDPESPLNFELDPFNATAELTASQQDDIIYAAQHPTPKPTEKSSWKKFWEIFF
jgi:hypothetical protein